MPDRDVQTIYTEDVSSGMGHVRLRVNEAFLTDERDNLDDAGEYREITEAEFLAKPIHLLCQRCAPRLDPA